MKFERNYRATTQRGSTLVVVALLMAAVAMLSLCFLTVLRSSQKENEGSREGLSALYACEAGLTAAVNELASGGDGDLGNENQPLYLGDQRYWVEATDIGGGRTALRSFGRDDGARMGVELVVQPSATGFFRWAAFSDEDLHMDSNARTDSYDSSAGSYLSQQINGSGSNAYANTEGDVGCNADISMDSNIGVYGDANPGPSGVVTAADPTKISGNTTPMANTIDLPGIVVPAIASSDAIAFDTQVLASGSYHYSTFQVNIGETLTITGPATIVCDDFRVKKNSNIVVDASYGPVEFFVLNDFILNANTSIASTDNQPLDVTFNLLSDNILDPGIDVDFDSDLLGFESNSTLFGTIYAPDASVTINSNFELFGSLVARRVDLNSNCRIHYDETLATANDGEVVYDTLCWRVVAQP
ncbi:MAG: hypothetical protein HOP15_01830 [Planctomycetes bacterium]|nr:hypothetical protein [Planctomycetota bacterium]